MYIFLVESIPLHCYLFESTKFSARAHKGYSVKRHSLKSFIKLPPKVESNLNVHEYKKGK